MISPSPERIRSRSFWLDDLDEPLAARPSLAGDVDVDVCIVGGGFTGLWTALALREGDPRLRVLVVEAEVCGFGASGRNGGWASALFPVSLERLAETVGREPAIAQWRAMVDTVDALEADCERLGIDAGLSHGGTLTLATSAPQLHRLRTEVDAFRRFGFGEADVRLLTASEVADRCGARGVVGAMHTPHCCAVQPARLVRGLAAAAEAAGVRIVEGTRATAIEPGRVSTEGGVVRAPFVVRALEGFTARLPGARRDLLPLYSLMIVTEPLAESVWQRIGLADRATFSDARNLLVYGQRTVDGRLAFGGRGAPYHWGSAVADRFDRSFEVADRLRRDLVALFPEVADARITHHWGGPLGVPRDWMPSVRLDGATGVATAGGYVGDGVATAHLAGHTLADMILGRDTDRVRLPWVDHQSPDWEPEPLRWFGVNLVRRLAAGADEYEARHGRPDPVRSRVLGLLSSH